MSSEPLPPTLVLALASTSETDTDPGFVFVNRREQETTYSHWEIYQRARRAAGALWEHGVRRGDRVSIILPTGQPFMDALYGCQLLGAIPVPMYPPVRLGRLDEYYARTAVMLSAVRACTMVTEKRISRLMGQVFSRYRPPLGTLDAARLQNGPDRAPAEVSPDELAMVQFSSGTTVAPKPVALTHRQVIANVSAISEHLPLEDGVQQTGCTWLPLYHDMGLIGCVYSATLLQKQLTLIPPEVFLSRPALWLRAISRHKSLVSPAPNFAYALCAERIKDSELEGCDLSSWKVAMNGAEPVAPAALRAFQERFQKWGFRPEAMTPVYGLAEAALAVTFTDVRKPYQTIQLDRESLQNGQATIATEDSSPDSRAEYTSVGRPLRGFSIDIRNKAGTSLPEGQIGHIWIKGPSIMEGYLDREAQPIQDGWLDSGDLGFILDGELFISGRAKDVLILRGQNHAPHDLEHAVDRVDGVRVGCAVAVGEVSEAGERLLMFVEYRDKPREGLAEECRKAVLTATGLNPDLVLMMAPGTLPRTSSGKLRRAETLRRYQANELTPPDKVTPWLIAGAMARSMMGYARSRS